MPRLVTVWDTNIYRKVNQAVYAEIQSHEMQHGVIAFACYAVVMELLAHLATPQTPDGKAAMAALRRLCHHCTEFDGSYKIVRFVAPAQEQVPKLLFGDAPQFPNEADYYADLIGALTTNSGYLTTRHDQLAAICRAAEQDERSTSRCFGAQWSMRSSLTQKAGLTLAETPISRNRY